MNERGFTLLEVVFALTLIAVAVIATAPLFVYAMQQNATGGDLGTVGALAVERMEILRATSYTSLPVGGDLNSNVAGYFDNSDPDAVVRWIIAVNPSPPTRSKQITVRAISRNQVIGQPKQFTVLTVRGG